MAFDPEFYKAVRAAFEAGEHAAMFDEGAMDRPEWLPVDWDGSFFEAYLLRAHPDQVP